MVPCRGSWSLRAHQCPLDRCALVHLLQGSWGCNSSTYGKSGSACRGETCRGPEWGLQETMSVLRDAQVRRTGCLPTHHSSLRRHWRGKLLRERGAWKWAEMVPRALRASSTTPALMPRCLHENINSSGTAEPGHPPYAPSHPRSQFLPSFILCWPPSWLTLDPRPSRPSPIIQGNLQPNEGPGDPQRVGFLTALP